MKQTEAVAAEFGTRVKPKTDKQADIRDVEGQRKVNPHPDRVS